MSDPKDCRARAVRCTELASKTKDSRLQELLLDMADRWLQLATELERTQALLEHEEFGLKPRAGIR